MTGPPAGTTNYAVATATTVPDEEAKDGHPDTVDASVQKVHVIPARSP